MTDHNDQHVTVKPVKKSSFPWWAIVLLVVFVLLCAGTTYVGQRVLRWRDYSLSLADVMRGDPTNTPRPRATSTPRESNTANNRVAAASESEVTATPARVADGGVEPTQTPKVVTPPAQATATHTPWIVTATFTPQGPANDPTPKPVTPTPAPQGNKGEETYTAGGGSGNQDTINNMPEYDWAPDGSWRVQKAQTYSYGPQLGYSEPGFGSAEDEVGIVVGYHLTIYTRQGLQEFDGGCQQFAFPPGVYARNSGGTDWGAIAYRWNPEKTSWENELAVLTWEAAKQQVQWEECQDLADEDLLDHVYVIEQDGEFVKATPWREYRRASGVDRTIMFAPGDRVYGWHLGLGSAWTGVPGQNGQDNLCDGGNCYLAEAPTFGWVGGGIINSTWPGEIPSDAASVPQSKIDQVMATLPE